MLCVLCLCCIIGCYGAQTVKIKVGINSKVDMEGYDSIAVIGFIDSKKNAFTNEGRTLARMIRKQLRNSKEFSVLDEGSTYLVLNEEVDVKELEKPENIISICKHLGVDALVIGAFDFRQISRPVPYIVESYSSQTGRYTPETRTYIQNSYHLTFRAKLVDGETAKTIFDFSPRTEIKPQYRRQWDNSIAGAIKGDSPSLRSMAVRPVTAFAMSLVPHYEYERRILAQ